MLIHRLTAALVLSLALTPALAACVGDAITPPPLTPATSTVSSPTPTEQPETAEEFIRRWQAEADKMQNTGESIGFLALGRDCTACDKFATRVSGIYERGGFIEFDGTRVIRVTPRSATRFDVRVKSGGTRYSERAGAAVQEYDGGKATFAFQLQRVSDAWFVHDFSEVAGTS